MKSANDIDRNKAVQTWMSEWDSTTSWNLRIESWRVSFHWTIHRHRSHNGDRWVLQSSSHYDRKPSTSSHLG